MPKRKKQPRKPQARKRFPLLAVLCNDPRCNAPHGVTFGPLPSDGVR